MKDYIEYRDWGSMNGHDPFIGTFHIPLDMVIEFLDIWSRGDLARKSQSCNSRANERNRRIDPFAKTQTNRGQRR
jgi:hypothetical protein